MKTKLFLCSLVLAGVQVMSTLAAQNCRADFTFTVNGNTVTFTNTSTGNNINNYSWSFGDGTYNQTTNATHQYAYKGTYFVCVTIQSGDSSCGDSTTCKPVVITTGCDSIYVAPFKINQSSPSVCDGAIDLTITGGTSPYTYTWLPNVSSSASASGLCTGYYETTVIDSKGCKGSGGRYVGDSINTGGCSTSVYLTQVFNSKSFALFVSSRAVGTSPLTYLWDLGDGTTSDREYLTHNYTMHGRYVICLTVMDATGCTSKDCASWVFAPLTSIDENTVAVSSIYPNPANDVLSVLFAKSIQGELRILDRIGREVYKEKINTNNVKVNVSNLPMGLYDLSIVSGDKISHNKILIAR